MFCYPFFYFIKPQTATKFLYNCYKEFTNWK